MAVTVPITMKSPQQCRTPAPPGKRCRLPHTGRKEALNQEKGGDGRPWPQRSQMPGDLYRTPPHALATRLRKMTSRRQR